MEPGTRARLIGDPSRIGVTTGKTKQRGVTEHCQVVFPDGTLWVPADQLEPISEELEDLVALLEKGRVGQASDLRRILTHVRLSGRLANVIYSMDATGTDFYAYQFKPVVKLLNSINSGILIADEVGLGKTIEAGLVWTELRSRFEFRRLLVLCPAVLREKWRDELRDRFGVEAVIADATNCLSHLTRAASDTQSSTWALIGSLQGLRPRRNWDEVGEPGGDANHLARFLQARQHDEPLVDLLVIDEAHYLRNRETMTATLGRLVRDVAQYVVLLTATPIHLKSQDLFQLMNLVDQDTFDLPGSFDDVLQANAPLVALRDALLAGRLTPQELVQQLEAARSHPLLTTNRQIQAVIESPPSETALQNRREVSALAYKLDTINLLGHALTRTRKRDVTEWRVLREPTSLEVPLRPCEAEFYEAVTQVVREFCEHRGAHEGFLLVTPQRQMCSSMPAALRSWRQRRDKIAQEVYEDFGYDDGEEIDEEVGPVVGALMAQVEQLGDLDVLWANDSKYERLRAALKRFFAEGPAEKAIIFSYFRATLEYLGERLSHDGLPCIVLMGGVEDKTAVVRAFHERTGPLVLLSSEVGSEGIDLQFCWVVINYDLPWNPMRVEQRIGRVDRLGQQSPKVAIWNLFYENTIDSRIYHRLHERLRIFEHSLGALEPVLGDKIRELVSDLFRKQLSPEQESARIEQTAVALENKRIEEEKLEDDAAQLIAYGDYILNEVKAARELSRRIDGGDILNYVCDFLRLRYPGCELRQLGDDPFLYHIELSSQAKVDLEHHIRKERLGLTTRLLMAVSGGTTYRFENSVLKTKGGNVELISQFHPLARFVAHSLRERSDWAHRAVAAHLAATAKPASVASGVYAFSVQLWSVSALQDIEKLHFAVAPLQGDRRPLDVDDAERLVSAATVHGQNWAEVASEVDFTEAARMVDEVCLAGSDESYAEFERDYRRQNEDRAELQEKSLDKHFTNQLQSLSEVRDRHVAHGRANLVKATEGRMKALKNRVEMKRIEIKTKRAEMKIHKREICVGVIRVAG